uniref:SSD domain-containing protein n=1 Tax=Branchiostoma floridae TaxID=7739 RepID=C3YBQ8_BRAFL|eukprot:XP_002606405.1 hypothetical protein BRAFLDRAFT_67656 [Branchiostoma floridae]
MEHSFFERWMSKGFKKFGRLITKQPGVFLFVSLLVAGGLGGGLYFIDNENSIEKLYTPDSGAGKVERAYVQEHFPTNDSEHFLPSRLATSGRYAAVIVRGRGDLANNVLHEVVVKAASSLHKDITEIKTEDRGLNYTSICARWESECVVTGLNLLDFIAAQVPNATVRYPLEDRIFSGAVLGGVTLEDGVDKPFLGMVGVLGAGMAVLATIGLMAYCGIKFNTLVAAMPFLVVVKRDLFCAAAADFLINAVSCVTRKKNPSDNRKIIILTYLILDKVSSSLCQVVCIKATSLVDHPAPFHAILGRHFYVSGIIIRTQIVIECYNFRCLYVLLIF